jgi:hypothetical protein
MAPKKADQKPETKKPGTRCEASCNMRALMTNKKRPNVSNVNGKVRILRINPRVALTRPITRAAMSAVPNQPMEQQRNHRYCY